jgi:Zn-dependent protease/CBS domain-containing protein
MRAAATPSGQSGLRIARAFGIPIFVHPSWLVIFGLIAWTLATGYFPERYPNLPAKSYWARGLIASLLFFGSILLHELGHSLVALRRGIPIRSITLFIFGGVARLGRDPEDGRTEFEIAAAGPLVSVSLAALFYGAGVWLPLGAASRAVATYLAYINLAIAIFNLVPAFPLDGGRLLRGLLWRRAGKLRATRAASAAGTAFAYVLIVAGVLFLIRGEGISGVWYVLIGWFLKEAAASAFREVRLDEVLGGVTVSDAMIREVETLPAEISLGEAAHDFFLKSGYGGYPVVRGESVVGLICLRDLLRHPVEERETTSVQAIMRPLDEQVVVAPHEPLARATGQIAQAGTGRLLVMDGPRLVGLLTVRAVFRHVRVREQLA